jgi:hypothetical protein
MQTNATLPQKAPKGSASQRHVLHTLAMLYGWQKIVEVGVWKGDTSAYLLAMLPQLKWFGVDPFKQPKGDLSEPGFCNYGEPDFEALYRATSTRVGNFGYRAKLIRKPSIEAAKDFKRQSVDAVFIDGDHRFEHVRADIAAWISVADHMLLGHDYDMPSVRDAVKTSLPKADIIELPDRVWGVFPGAVSK